MADSVQGFSDAWIWMIFVAIGLFLILLELIIGVETGLDLVFLGSAFIIGGLVTWPVHSWVLTLIITAVICAAYVAIGRRYVHRWTTVRQSKTNIDTIIGTGDGSLIIYAILGLSFIAAAYSLYGGLSAVADQPGFPPHG